MSPGTVPVLDASVDAELCSFTTPIVPCVRPPGPNGGMSSEVSTRRTAVSIDHEINTAQRVERFRRSWTARRAIDGQAPDRGISERLQLIIDRRNVISNTRNHVNSPSLSLYRL